MLFSFFSLALASTFTIDFGSYYTKSSLEGESRIPVVGINIYSKRLTPTFVAFKTEKDFNNETSEPLDESEIRKLIPVIGEQAQNVLRSKPWTGSGYLSNFIDIDDVESRNLSQKLKVSPPNDTRFKLFNLTSTFLHFYAKMILGENFGKTNTRFVIPGDFSTPQINWLTDAARHAKLKNITTIFDWEAVANSYAQRRPEVIEMGHRTGLFIDVGATSTKAYTIQFIALKGIPRYSAKLISYHVDHDAGGAFVTDNVAQLIIQKIRQNSQNNDDFSPAEISTIYEAAETVKCKLSILPKVTITIEDVFGKDHTIDITVEELNKAAGNQINRMIRCAMLEFRYGHPDFIEVIGGSSRIPLFREKLSKLTSSKLSTSLNADESLALGAQYFAIRNWVKGEMNVSFYGVSMCEYMFCHDLLLGTGTDLGFQDNPEVFYFNITTPLRRGIVSYNWSYYARKPMRQFTNYFFFKRNPVEFLYGQQCYSSSCKNQTVTLITPDYGDFLSIIESESNLRYNLAFETNLLEEKYNYLNQVSDIIETLDEKSRQFILSIKNQIHDYLHDKHYTKDQTKRSLELIETATKIIDGKHQYLLHKENLKDAINSCMKITEVVYPNSIGWIDKKLVFSLRQKIKHAEVFLENINGNISNEEIVDETAALKAWCQSLPPMPKIPERGPLKKFLFKIGNKLFDIIEKIKNDGISSLLNQEYVEYDQL